MNGRDSLDNLRNAVVLVNGPRNSGTNTVSHIRADVHGAHVVKFAAPLRAAMRGLHLRAHLACEPRPLTRLVIAECLQTLEDTEALTSVEGVFKLVDYKLHPPIRMEMAV
jgi:hypothetical protein